jgi:hypothetical protein
MTLSLIHLETWLVLRLCNAENQDVGTLLDNTSFQVCIGLRLGCNLCTPHICKCNAKADEIDIHGLSCSKSSGRFSRHTEINSTLRSKINA